MNTVVALVLGYFVLNERVSVPALAAVALILVGVVMISRVKSVPSA